jgi:hypothetical protein
MIVTIKKIARGMNWGLKEDGKFVPKFSGCFDKWVPGLDKITGALKTGLTKTEETEFEDKLGLPTGTLGKNSKYWESFVVIIPDKGLTLNTENPMDELIYKTLKADSFIAGSAELAKQMADVDYVMTSEVDEAKVKNTRRKRLADAYSVYKDLSSAEIIDALFLFGKNPATTSLEICEGLLGEILEKNPDTFLEKLGDPDKTEKIFIMKLAQKGIIRKIGSSPGYDIPLYFEDTMLGGNMEEAVKFLKNKENSNIYILLKQEYDKIR